MTNDAQVWQIQSSLTAAVIFLSVALHCRLFLAFFKKTQARKNSNSRSFQKNSSWNFKKNSKIWQLKLQILGKIGHFLDKFYILCLNKQFLCLKSCVHQKFKEIFLKTHEIFQKLKEFSKKTQGIFQKTQKTGNSSWSRLPKFWPKKKACPII